MVIDFGEGMEFEATFNGFTPICVFAHVQR